MGKGTKIPLREMRRILSEWYGIDSGNVEISAYQPQPKPISEFMDKISKRIVSKYILDLIELKKNWSEIAGAQIAAVSTPAGIYKGTVTLDVAHNMWVRELSGASKKILIEKINKHFNEEFCKDLRCRISGNSFQGRQRYDKRRNTYKPFQGGKKNSYP
jgi:predicted nucleic acid-binding Zn ribbon protein